MTLYTQGRRDKLRVLCKAVDDQYNQQPHGYVCMRSARPCPCPRARYDVVWPLVLVSSLAAPYP